VTAKSRGGERTFPQRASFDAAPTSIEGRRFALETSTFGQSSKLLPEEFRHPVTLRSGRALSGLGLMDLLGAILLVVAAVALTAYLILLES
jgi:hypothetical protein